MPLPATLADIDTPALVLDLDLLEANVAVLARHVLSLGVAWRPTVDTHRLPDIARRQLAAGADGVTVATLTAAEYCAAAGVQDLFIARPVVGPAAVARLTALARTTRPIVCCDHYAQAEPLAKCCAAQNVRPRVLIELNLGRNQLGVRPGSDAVELARAVVRLEGVEFAGLTGDAAHLQSLPDADERQHRTRSAMGLLVQTREQLQSAGITCPIVSPAGIHPDDAAAMAAGVTELQLGDVLSAPSTIAFDAPAPAAPLALLATVVSRPKLERAVLDCGLDSLSAERPGPQVLRRREGRPLPDAVITGWSASHLTLDLGPRSQDLHIGDRVWLHPGCIERTTLLHSHCVGMRRETIEALLPLIPPGSSS